MRICVISNVIIIIIIIIIMFIISTGPVYYLGRAANQAKPLQRILSRPCIYTPRMLAGCSVAMVCYLPVDVAARFVSYCAADQLLHSRYLPDKLSYQLELEGGSPRP